MSADADKIFYCNARFDDNVEITKNHLLVLRFHTKKFDHRNDTNVQSVFCVIFQHILNIVFKSIKLKSYLSILQYDATLFGNHNTRKLKEEMITFNLRPHSAFPKMGV